MKQNPFGQIKTEQKVKEQLDWFAVLYLILEAPCRMWSLQLGAKNKKRL